jgi:hypothetical protein|tara:strand:- start:633 stop:1010 length:378 start_codon:yes stop_codon:yes gene_type:complete
MKTLVLGVLVVFTGLSYLGNKRATQIRTYLDDNYGRKNMDIVGYLGGGLQLAAVTAVSRGWLSNTSAAYHGISLIGSTGLLLTAFYHEAMAPVLVNIIWMGMNTVGIFEGITNMQALSQITQVIG